MLSTANIRSFTYIVINFISKTFNISFEKNYQGLKEYNVCNCLKCKNLKKILLECIKPFFKVPIRKYLICMY